MQLLIYIIMLQAITVPVSVTAYNVSFLSPSGTIISSEVITIPCLDQTCAIDVLSFCSSLPSVNFTVSAMNSFGRGPPSNVYTIGNIYIHLLLVRYTIESAIIEHSRINTEKATYY